MKLAANLSLLFTELPFEERPAAARQAGFEGAEVLFPYDLPASALRRLMADSGMQLALINTPLGPLGEPGLAAVDGAQAGFRDAVDRALDVACETSCPTIHVMAGRPDPLLRAADVRRVLVDNLRWASSRALRYGITLTLEALNRIDMPGYAYHLPSEALKVIAQTGASNLRLQFDFFHAARERLDWLVVLDECRAAIHHAQLAQAPDRTQPDLADAGLLQALQRLVSWNSVSWLGLEYRPPGSTAASLDWMPAMQALLSRTTDDEPRP